MQKKQFNAIGKTAKLYFVMARQFHRALDGSHVKDAQIATDGGYYKISARISTAKAPHCLKKDTRKAVNGEVTVDHRRHVKQ